jgi:WD40 repeat protein
VRTPVSGNENNQTVSVKKFYLPSNSDVPIFDTQSVESTPLPPIPEVPYPRLRNYEILSIIGSGGMGIVYEARHRELNRRVAIKTLRGEALLGPEFRERFRAEAEAIASLQHPNIIQVFEVGTLEQQPGGPHSHPFIALEFVNGGSLIERSRTPQPSMFAARTVETLARAAHAAHQLGIVHRDLKPANVLLTGDGVPKIADFGIAKQIEAKQTGSYRQLTRDGSVMGTPEYMAPEQFSEVKATPAIDIYALGVILYELLTGRVPFQGATFPDTMMLTMHQDPVPPRYLRPEVPRDLEVICLKCLEKTPSRRYESAEALADDLARWAEGRPILARPVGTAGRTLRWARRNPAVAALSLLVIVVTLVGFAGIALKWNEAEDNATKLAIEAKKAEHEATNARDAAKKERWERYRVCVVAASSELRLDDSNAARRALEDAPEEYRDWVWSLLHARLDKAQYVLQDRECPLIGVFFTEDGRWAMLRGEDHSIHVWDTQSRKEYVTVRGNVYVRCPIISEDGKTLAFETPEHTIVLRDAQTGRDKMVLPGHTKQICQLEFSRDGKRLISISHDFTIRVWDTTSGQLIREMEHGSPSGGAIKLSPDQRLLAFTTHKAPVARLWDTETGREIAVLPGHDEGVRLMRFSPSGDRIATAEAFPNNILRLWDVSSGKLLATMRGHMNQINAIRFSDDEKSIATCSMDRTVRIWDNSPAPPEVEPEPRLVLKGHTGWVRSCAFSPDGNRLISSSYDATLRCWNAKNGDQLAVLRGHSNVVELVAFTQNGSSIISAGLEGSVRIWDAREAERDQAIRGHERFVYGVAFHPNGDKVASASWDGTARIWNATTGRELLSLDHGKNKIISAVAFHPTGRFIATVARDNGVRLLDAESGKLVHVWRVPTIDWRDTRVAFSPKGDLLASGSPDGRVRLLDVNTRTEYAILEGHKDGVRDVAFSPDGRWLASAGELNDRTVRIWDIERKSQIQLLSNHTACVYALAWNHNGTLLASGSIDGTIRIWDTSNWSEVGKLKPGTNVYCVKFTNDGKLLAAACADNLIRFWDVKTQQEIGDLSGHGDYVHSLAFSPDGTRLVSASGDRTIRVWDTLPPAERAKK